MGRHELKFRQGTRLLRYLELVAADTVGLCRFNLPSCCLEGGRFRRKADYPEHLCQLAVARRHVPILRTSKGFAEAHKLACVGRGFAQSRLPHIDGD